MPKKKTVIRPYDLTKPPSSSVQQFDKVDSIHERFCANFKINLSKFLNRAANVTLVSTDALTNDQMIQKFSNPSLTGILSLIEVGSTSLFHLETGLLSLLLELSLGGKPSAKKDSQKEPTQIEHSIGLNFLELALKDLESAWAETQKMDFKLSRSESDPKLIRVFPPQDEIHLTTFEVSLPLDAEVFSIALPFRFLRSIQKKLI